MPGMMDTILNLGINDAVEQALARETGDAEFARDTHRRFIDSYARTVLGAEVEAGRGATPADLRSAVKAACGSPVPEDPVEHLRGAIGAVFKSWESPRAIAYRQHHGISDEGGTGVTVQVMVFGNLDERSGTGVFFTRDPASGAPRPYGDFLPTVQGEDVVSGTVDPVHLDEPHRRLPDIYDDLLRAGSILERDSRDVQDIEFTVQGNRHGAAGGDTRSECQLVAKIAGNRSKGHSSNERLAGTEPSRSSDDDAVSTTAAWL
jgi:pyruvate,orthophosphate dikinase